MTDKVQGIDIVAVREHSITSRRTRVHVIICHNLDERAHTLYEMFRFADKVSPETLAALTRELADAITRDADMLIAELQRIKAFAQREVARLLQPLRE
jgi:ferric iron reductase protein FhuF